MGWFTLSQGHNGGNPKYPPFWGPLFPMRNPKTTSEREGEICVILYKTAEVANSFFEGAFSTLEAEIVLAVKKGDPLKEGVL